MYKNIKKKKNYSGYTGLGIFTILFMLVISCTEGFDQLNTPTDRVVASEVDGSLLGQAFADAQWRGVRGGGGSLQTGKNLFADLYSQYFATTSANFDSDQFEEIGSWVNGGVWRSIYGNALRSMDFVLDFTEENDLEVQNAVARIWSVHIFHQLTDYFGPIIYSEYGNGERVVNYDSQEEVYLDFFNVLESAVNVLEQNRGTNVYGQNDIIFGGDVNKWISYGNSLRLRLAMRIAYVEPEMARDQAEDAVAGGVMVDNSENAWVATTDNNRNDFTRISEWMEFRMSASMESILLGFEDPRIENMFSEASQTEDQVECGACGYRGLRNGLPRGDKNPELNFVFSDLGQEYLPASRGGGNPPVEVMRASEVYLLRAEGALRGWSMGGTAQELYEEGIRASIEEWGVATPDQIDDYINSTNTPADYTSDFEPSWNMPALSDITIAWDTSGDLETNLEQIITQKWIALYPEGLEAYAEYRRTKYPKLYPIIESRNSNIPEDGQVSRLTFVSSEYSQNPDGVQTGIEKLDGPDENHTKLWWDEKPE